MTKRCDVDISQDPRRQIRNARRMYTAGMITFFLSGLLVLITELLNFVRASSASSSSDLTYGASCMVLALNFWLLRRTLPASEAFKAVNEPPAAAQPPQ